RESIGYDRSDDPRAQSSASAITPAIKTPASPRQGSHAMSCPCHSNRCGTEQQQPVIQHSSFAEPTRSGPVANLHRPRNSLLAAGLWEVQPCNRGCVGGDSSTD